MDAAFKQAVEMRITPLGDQANMAVSPRMAQVLIMAAAARANGSLEGQKFKRVREEIMPAVDFALFLKLAGLGEHYILSKDAPDIALVKLDRQVVKTPIELRKIPALLLEIMHITDEAMASASGSTTTEKIANLMTTKKFSKRYEPATNLLVILDAECIFDPNELNSLISAQQHSFGGIFLKVPQRDYRHLIIRLFPRFGATEIDDRKDFPPLIY